MKWGLLRCLQMIDNVQHSWGLQIKCYTILITRLQALTDKMLHDTYYKVTSSLVKSMIILPITS